MLLLLIARAQLGPCFNERCFKLSLAGTKHFSIATINFVSHRLVSSSILNQHDPRRQHRCFVSSLLLLLQYDWLPCLQFYNSLSLCEPPFTRLRDLPCVPRKVGFCSHFICTVENLCCSALQKSWLCGTGTLLHRPIKEGLYAVQLMMHR